MQYASQDARFSRCKKYRYSLTRSWEDGSGKVVFIGLNPSTADQNQDDPTIHRCVNFAKSWGYSSIEMVNLFAYCATNPEELKMQQQAIGPANNQWIASALQESKLTIACWGNHGSFKNRAAQIQGLYPRLHCLAINKSGQAKHPLYIKGTQTPFLFSV